MGQLPLIVDQTQLVQLQWARSNKQQKSSLYLLTSTTLLSFSKERTNWSQLRQKVDTGSSATTVTESMYAKHFSHIGLKPPSKVLRNFDDSPVKGIKGSIGLDAYCGDKKQHMWVYVTSDIASAVIGRNLI